AKADELAQARIQGRWHEVSGDVQRALSVGRDSVEVLRVHAAEGPYETTDLARMLQVVSCLETVAGRLAEAAATLDEAIAVMTPIADRGPTFASLLHGMRSERDGLRGDVPDTRG